MRVAVNLFSLGLGLLVGGAAVWIIHVCFSRMTVVFETLAH